MKTLDRAVCLSSRRRSMPWLPRPLIVVAWVLVGLVGFARVYFGAQLPLDVVGGVGVGLVCGAIAGAVVGIPAVPH